VQAVTATPMGVSNVTTCHRVRVHVCTSSSRWPIWSSIDQACMPSVVPPAYAAGSALIGSKAPFRLMSDHVRCGRLEAATSSVRDWWVWRSLHRLCATASWGP
jgi:hypothetical protein